MESTTKTTSDVAVLLDNLHSIHIGSPADRVTNIDAYRLRYKVYVEEMQLECPNADHVNRFITDRLDQTGYIFNYYKNDECVSTLRGNILSEADIGSLESLYSIDPNVEPEKTSILTKFVVDSKSRQSMASYNVVRDAFLLGLSKGVTRAYMDSVPTLTTYYEKLGFIGCGETFVNEETGLLGQPMYIQMDNIEYLNEIRSPLAKLYMAYIRNIDDEAFV